MIILGLDMETTGREPTIHSVTEVGAVMWETTLRTPIREIGQLVYDPDAVWEPGVTSVNGITPEICKHYGKDSKKVLQTLISWYQQSDVVCAHNGNIFDRPVFFNWCDRFGFHDYKDENKVWIDTTTDIDIPRGWPRKLQYLATHLGLHNPFPHRAVFDVMAMLMILDRFDLNRTMELAKSPTVIIQALVSYDQKDWAKDLGYYWRPERKVWIKSVKAARVGEEEASAARAFTEVSRDGVTDWIVYPFGIPIDENMWPFTRTRGFKIRLNG
jgi:DNA polymerase-3 subunit epsilon